MFVLTKLLKTLSNLRGISGFEYMIADDISKLISPYADEVYSDNIGNIIALKRCGKPDAPKIMIEGHIDEIGLIVSDIDEGGFVKFTNVGGIDTRILPSCEVTIHGKENVSGVIGAKPPHLQSADESKKSIKITDMSIDTGLDKNTLSQLVQIGDPITMATAPEKLFGKYFSGKTLDDRAGVYSIIKVMENIRDKSLNADIYAVLATCEEVGLRGATVAAHSINPDVAIAIDVCHGITPDNSDDAFECGGGAVISVGPNLHPGLSKILFDIADKYNIDVQKAAEPGNTGTDAWAIQVSREGIPTALISIPLKYMHTSVETLSMDDLLSNINLLTSFITDFEDCEVLKCY